jgi:hypothetical protein
MTELTSKQRKLLNLRQTRTDPEVSPRKQISQQYSSTSNSLANPSAAPEPKSKCSQFKADSLLKNYASHITTLPGTLLLETPEKLTGKKLNLSKSRSQLSFDASIVSFERRAQLSKYIKNLTSDDCIQLRVRGPDMHPRKREGRTNVFTSSLRLA